MYIKDEDGRALLKHDEVKGIMDEVKKHSKVLGKIRQWTPVTPYIRCGGV